MHYRFNLLTHIIVLVTEFKCCRTFTIFSINFTDKAFYFLLAALETCTVMITDNIGHCSLLYITVETDEMVEAFVTFSMFGCFMSRQHRTETVSHTN